MRLVAVAQMAADTGLFRPLLTLTMHHAAALAELSQAGHSEWGEPPDGSRRLAPAALHVYRSGFFAARSGRRDEHSPAVRISPPWSLS